MQGRFARISNNSSEASMIKHVMIKNKMFVVKLHLSGSQCNDIGLKPLSKQ